MSYEKLFLYSLAITLLIEVPIVFLLAKYTYKITSKWNVIFAGIITSTLTLPYLWFILPLYISDRTIYIIVGEILVVLIEAFIYYRVLKLKFIQALLVSFIANLVSFSIGLL